MIPFLPLTIALRYLISGRTQTTLMVALVMVGSLVYVFITSLLTGVQFNVVNSTIGEISQVTITAPDDNPQLLSSSTKDKVVFSDIQNGRNRPEKLPEWEKLVAQIETDPGVKTVSPVALVGGFMTKGGKTKPITFNGVNPEKVSGINKLSAKMKEGIIDFTSKRIVIGSELSKNLNAKVGDKVLIRSEKGNEGNYTVAGIFEFGTKDQNERTVFGGIEEGQRLGDIVGSVNRIEIHLKEVFESQQVASRIRNATGQKVTPWPEQFPAITASLSQIEMSKNLIRVFALVSVAFGIASVLGVSVVQKSKEIGIMKGMGTKTWQILMIFLFSGGLIGIIGAPVGAGLGATLINFLASRPAPPGGTGFPGRFEMAFFWQAVIISFIVCLLSGLGPARKAAKMDPVEAIRSV